MITKKQQLKQTILCSVIVMCLPMGIQAAVFSVTNPTDDGTGSVLGSLSWAISQTNTNPGNDTITIETDVTLSTFASGTNGLSGTPSILGNVNIIGNSHTLERDETLTCNPNSDFEIGEFRLFHVASSGALRISQINLRNGCIEIINV